MDDYRAIAADFFDCHSIFRGNDGVKNGNDSAIISSLRHRAIALSF